jgi:hypothetical protein
MSESLASTAVLVVRVWIEGDASTGFRARLIRTLDVEQHGEVVTSAASADDVLAAVKDWLDEITAAGANDPAGGAAGPGASREPVTEW